MLDDITKSFVNLVNKFFVFVLNSHKTFKTKSTPTHSLKE